MLHYNYPWLQDPEIKNLMKLFKDNNEEVRFVGGCVRDNLLGLEVQDLDMATTALPEKVFKILSDQGIMVIPTGIDHGTVTIVLSNGDRIEITTLREDIETDGRHAKVKYSTNWMHDANRRDFTINSLYLDSDGKIYDPTGLGIKDLESRTVRFIGNPEERIKEDYLRILRFFRFCVVCDSKIDEGSLLSCVKYKDSLSYISKERIKIEIEKLLSYNNCYDVVLLMLKHKIFDKIFSYLSFSSDRFTDIKNGGSWNVCNWLIRLVSLIDYERISMHHSEDFGEKCKSQNEIVAYFLRKDLNLSNIETQRIKNILQELPDSLISIIKKYNIMQDQYDFEFAVSELKKCAYYSSISSVLSALIINDCDVIDFLDYVNWSKPKLPINGLDVIKNVDSEIITGTILSQVEKWWVSHNFAPNREDCLFYMKKLIAK